MTSSGSCGVGFVCSIRGIKSHYIVRWGVEAVKNLTHRGAVGSDGKTGDGAGILTQIPRKFFLREIERHGFSISDSDNIAAGFFFLREEGSYEIGDILEKCGFRIICWRDVPTNDDALGESALKSKPVMRQLLIDAENVDYRHREPRLYLARKAIERRYGENVYVPSLSSKTIVYKGMLVAPQLDRFYPDLLDEDFESAFCLFHQRFSTNTFPDWRMAQPLRAIAHNGEINTIKGNRNWMSHISPDIRHEVIGDERDIILPLVSDDESDSASLDNIMELLVRSGCSPERAVNMCVPPSWEDSELSDDAKAFFEYHSFLMKPWDGPAAIVFTDGDSAGAHLDRNGLRPLRYTITEDEYLVLGSETGMVDLDGKTIREKGRLAAGETISVDLIKGRVKHTREIIEELSAGRHYRPWMEQNLFRLKEDGPGIPDEDPDLLRKQVAFGYTEEEIRTAIKSMAENAKEMTYSMGDDTPIPPLSEKPLLLFRYFRQRFSQVTNPPIDPIRERPVMTMKMALGYKRNFLEETPEHARRLKIDSPLLFQGNVVAVETQEMLKVRRISIAFSRDGGRSENDAQQEKAYPDGYATAAESPLLLAVRSLQRRVVDAVGSGAEIIILSDRDISKEKAAIPSLLALSASFRALQSARIANRASFIVETGEARDIHHVACLIGYGASAVFPYLLFQTMKDMREKGIVTLPFEQAAINYRKAVEDGLLKVIARMGISTLNSYHAAQLFDPVCLNGDFVEDFFGGTPTIESDGLREIEESLMKRHESAFAAEAPALDFGGDLKQRKGGEWHQWSTASVLALNKFVRSRDPALYEDYLKKDGQRPVYIRHLLRFKEGTPVPLDEVEPQENIVKRFFSGAMSVGALSPEAHETIAEACNILGMRSNSGEGGEDPARYWSKRGSAIKQIASGRFGVTPAYLASARELEIKIAQGAKPGEGGHLPANKVTEYIAMLRHCRPNTLLISPPPHHDIYSIEDLAQLINDLKQANPKAKVCVKLVSEKGVGTVAAGVVKAYADIIQISGCEGGTGASPTGSIKNAGNFWETGLEEAQRVLMENGLREKVILRVDGGLRTGKDVVAAAILGAEEFGFGTATMISVGCIMARQCHLNTCPTGVATQEPRLRANFRGTVEGVAAYFRAVAGEVREILASMGCRSIEEIIGRKDLLERAQHEAFPASKRIKTDALFAAYPAGKPKRCRFERNDNPAASMNERLLEDILPYIEKKERVVKEYDIRNIDRSIPVRLNYHIALRYGDEGLPDDTLNLIFRGTAGQSFGAFNHRGMSLTLIGDANDYVGKGMFGGRIVIRPHGIDTPRDQVGMGNTVLYGATGGELFVSGKAGERFAVRNSGAVAVAEGAGHHLCEYMTRGTVVVLGDVGHNVGAGMTGGVIYIYDEGDALSARINTAYVKIVEPEDEDEVLELASVIERHYLHTGSQSAGRITRDFGKFLPYLKKVVPV
jgi:glutamate synthase (NADPH/NADH) large chain